MSDPSDIESEQFCYVETTGRKTGRPHTIEIWFGMSGRTLYLLSGGGEASDWVRNLVAHPQTTVRIADQPFPATARIVTGAGEDALARRLLLEKYSPSYSGDLSDWGRTALPVALDLDQT